MSAKTSSGINWSHLAQRISAWHSRSRSLQELEFLSDATLRDIGVRHRHWSQLVRFPTPPTPSDGNL
jgi:uncharacterized protein YjiS (DUF1127 family)